jgi:hypothetical protein
MIFQGITMIFITRAQFELAACGWLMIEQVPAVKDSLTTGKAAR